MADANHSLMVQASAFRAKYRKVDLDGKAIKTVLPIESLGVHQKNRGGNYPGGYRCKSLCVTVLEEGFVKDEVNHACVVVEEARVEEILARANPDTLVTASKYNAEQCSRDELLLHCFKAPYDNVRYSMLSHNHMMLVMRSFQSRAKWDLPAHVEKKLVYCDSEGRLSATAVAAGANGKELGEMLLEGIACEVLSYKMELEEPGAAAIISSAMNIPQQLGMHTTELSAVAVLRGEIILQMINNLSQRVAFKTVLDRVRAELHHAADDPDLPEVFDFLISNGVGVNAYIDELLLWTRTYVDSKKRQLRFSSFGVINKMDARCPLSKVAVVKRAYRKPPVNGFCPCPECAWGDFGYEHAEKLEEILRFFHGSCKEIFAVMPPHSRTHILGNIDIAAAEAFWNTKPAKKDGSQKLEENLLAATSKYMRDLRLDDHSKSAWDLPNVAGWISFYIALDSAETKQDTPTLSAIPNVIHFDEKSGEKLRSQVEYLAPGKGLQETPFKLPWREWRAGIASSLANAEAEKTSAVAVLHTLHTTYDVTKEPIDVWTNHKGICYVTAQTKTDPGVIRLPPCISKTCKVYDRSEHPHAVQMSLEVRGNPGGDATARDESVDAPKITYYVNPEFKPPKHTESKNAVAGADVLNEEKSDVTAVADPWVWGPPGSETMHPFWAVRRMTKNQMAREAATASCDLVSNRVLPRFNCKLQIQVLSMVIVGVVVDVTVNSTRTCEVPFLTNSLQLEEGEELFLEVYDTEKSHKKDPAKRTWKDELKVLGKKQKLTKAI
jgi:hypothetical protein